MDLCKAPNARKCEYKRSLGKDCVGCAYSNTCPDKKKVADEIAKLNTIAQEV